MLYTPTRTQDKAALVHALAIQLFYFILITAPSSDCQWYINTSVSFLPLIPLFSPPLPGWSFYLSLSSFLPGFSFYFRPSFLLSRTTMRVPTSLLFAILLSIPTFAAPVAIPDDLALETRKAKAAVKKVKPVVKAKPVKAKKVTVAKKPVAKKPIAKKPVAKKVTAKKPVAKKPIAKKPVAKKPIAKKPTTAAGKKPIAKKPTTKPTPTKKATTAAATKAAAKKPVASKKPTSTAKKPVACPLPKKKTVARRFLDYIGVLSVRADSAVAAAASCAIGTTPTTKADKAAAKAKKAEDKKSKAASKSAAAAAAASSAAAARRPVGAVANAPSSAVQCNNKDGALTEIPLASLNTAVRLAQAGPLVGGKNPAKFPHAFNNREGVRVAAACVGHTLEEHAVGVSMSTFRNIPSVIGTDAFNQFRVIITTPDASGDTTFCGVMTHGTSTTGTFEADLCEEV
ncbi:hypothetical protein C8F01DRAFT_1376355 [Mycena amicta]|nr:hypothetical protein C8F01DRAFT_1376355 [Mycena amicta]